MGPGATRAERAAQASGPAPSPPHPLHTPGAHAPLAVPLLHVGQAVPLVGQGQQRLGEHLQVLHHHRQLALVGALDAAAHAHNVACVHQRFERGKAVGRGLVHHRALDVELQRVAGGVDGGGEGGGSERGQGCRAARARRLQPLPASPPHTNSTPTHTHTHLHRPRRVHQLEESQLAHEAPRQHAPRHCHRRPLRNLAVAQPRILRLQLRRRVCAVKGVSVRVAP